MFAIDRLCFASFLVTQGCSIMQFIDDKCQHRYSSDILLGDYYCVALLKCICSGETYKEGWHCWKIWHALWC